MCCPVEPWHQNLYHNTCKLYEQTLSLLFHPNVSYTQAKRIFEVLDKCHNRAKIISFTY